MRKKHGQHNLNLSELLLNDAEDYNDWVVTTAFYSAVHFVEHALFPLVEGNVEYLDFNEYWQNVYYPQNISKHTGKKDLVFKYIKTVGWMYKSLLDDCHSARYNNYNVSDRLANDAKKSADNIKAACLKIKS